MECLTLKKSNCKNCYKCIRHCPVKSIRFSGNQAYINDNECILCGHCFVVCPQNAKQIVDETEKVKVLLQSGDPVVVSLAPSFVANYDGIGIESMREALKKLGYETEYVEDTDRGINKKTGKPYKKMVSAEMKFQEAEREALTEICRQFGVEIENPKRSKDEYCTSKQLRQARDVRMQNEARSLELSDREQKVQEREAEASKILEQKKEVEAEKQSFEASKNNFYIS